MLAVFVVLAGMFVGAALIYALLVITFYNQERTMQTRIDAYRELCRRDQEATQRRSGFHIIG